MSETNEVELFYIVTGLIILILIISAISFIILFRRRQNELILKGQLEEEQYKNKLLYKDIESQEVLVKERERISEDIHDDIGGILSAIKLEAEYIKCKTQDDEIKKSLDSISANTLIATQNFRELVWCLHSQNDTLSEFIQYVVLYANSLFERSSIRLNVNQTFQHESIPMSSFQRRQLLFAIKECLNNILKHSQASHAELSLLFDKRNLCIKIVDNGIGFQIIKHSGHGLKNIERRLKSIGGLFAKKINPPQGTCIELSIPFVS